MRQQCEHMGAGADGFTELALQFHRRADTIVAASQKRSAAEVLSATSHTLQTCVQCHSTYRQDVVTASEWASRTSSGAHSR